MSREPRTVYVGRKPVMNYVLAVVTSFSESKTDKVILKARGNAITAAVDVAEISRRRFLEGVIVDKIEVGTEDMHIREENRTKKVSTIDITLARVPTARKEIESEVEEEKPVADKQAVKLTDIQGIGVKTAEKLEAHDIKSAQDLAKSDPRKLAENLQISEKRLSKWIDEAKKTVQSG